MIVWKNCLGAMLLLGAGITVLSTGAIAAPGEGEVAFYGGFSHFGDGGGNHATLGGAAGVAANSNLHLFGEFNYVPLGSSIRLLNFGGGVRAHLAGKDSRAKPYVLGVVGDGAFGGGGFSSNNNVYAGGGAGISFMAGERWGFRPEFRYQRYINNGGFNLFMVTGGLFYQFGK